MKGCPRYLTAVLAFAFAASMFSTLMAREQGAARSRDYAALVVFYNEFRGFIPPQVSDGLPDYTPAAIEAKKKGLKDFRLRLDAIDPSGWPASQRADYLLVKAELNGFDFQLEVLRPWARDPGFYVTTPASSTAGAGGPTIYDSMRLPREWSTTVLGPVLWPLPVDRLDYYRTKLQAVPKIFEQAKHNLIDVPADFAALAVRAKKEESHVYRHMAAELPKHHPDHPDLAPLAARAATAVDEFREWLELNAGRWSAPAGVGIDNYNWMLKYVWMVPYTWDDMLKIGTREYQQAVAYLKMVEHKHRDIPMYKPATTAEAYRQMEAEATRDLIDFLKREQIFTVPDYFTPDERARQYGRANPTGNAGRPDVEANLARREWFLVSENARPWKPGEPWSFWHEMRVRDERPLIAHGFVGHALDGLMWDRDTRPIRGLRRLFDTGSTRSNWSFYLEGMVDQTGWYDERSKTREINYNMEAERAARVAADLKIHSNEFTFRQAFRHLVEHTPHFMHADDPVAWQETSSYLRQPGGGVSYTFGKIQIEELLAQRSLQLREKFSLRQFHDDFLAAGNMPIALIRWEMTGLDDQVKHMWEPHQAPRLKTASSSSR